MALHGLAFLNIITEVPKWWLGDSYRVDNGLLGGQWWWVGITAAAGLAVGLGRAALLPKDPAPFLMALHDPKPDWVQAALIVLLSLMGLAAAAPLGPETPMGSAGLCWGACLAEKGRFRPQDRRGCIIMALTASFATMLPSSYLAATIMGEILLWSRMSLRLWLPQLLLLAVLSSTVSYYLFSVLQDFTFLKLEPLPKSAYDDYQYESWHILAAVPMGMAASAVTLTGVIILGLTRRVGAKVRAAGSVPLVAGASAAGLAYGVMGVCLPLTLTTGAKQIAVVLDDPGGLGAKLIAASLFGKIISMGFCQAGNLVGGLVTPLIFMGSCTGALLHLAFPKLPLLLTASAMTAAVPASVIPAPLGFALLSSQSLHLDARGTQPVFVACLVSYSCLSGSGILQWLVEPRSMWGDSKRDEMDKSEAGDGNEKQPATVS